mgnify:CR=1 FL=1
MLPSQCHNCGAKFDLWYEMLEGEERFGEDIQDKLGRELVESLCWGCKKQVLNVLTVQKEEKEEGLDELFLDLDFE